MHVRAKLPIIGAVFMRPRGFDLVEVDIHLLMGGGTRRGNKGETIRMRTLANNMINAVSV